MKKCIIIPLFIVFFLFSFFFGKIYSENYSVILSEPLISSSDPLDKKLGCLFVDIDEINKEILKMLEIGSTEYKIDGVVKLFFDPTDGIVLCFAVEHCEYWYERVDNSYPFILLGNIFNFVEKEMEKSSKNKCVLDIIPSSISSDKKIWAIKNLAFHSEFTEEIHMKFCRQIISQNDPLLKIAYLEAFEKSHLKFLYSDSILPFFVNDSDENVRLKAKNLLNDANNFHGCCF